MEILLTLASCVCVLALPTLTLGLPLVLAARRAIRARPEWRKRIALAFSVLNAVISSFVLAIGSVVLAFNTASEDPLTGSLFLALVGVLGSCSLGVGTMFAMILYATRPPRPDADTRPSVLPAWALGGSIALLVVGVGTSLVGLALALSFGLISLAGASVASRPLACGFAVLHAAMALVSVLALRRDRQAWPGWASLVVSLVGLWLALLIAVFAPDFFASLIGAAARGLVV